MLFTDGPSADTCYGADFSGDRLIVVRASRSRKGLRHETVFDGAPAAFPAGVAGTLRGEAEAGAAVTAACLPVHESFARWLHTPLTSVAKARKVLPSLLDIQLPFPLEMCTYRFVAERRAADGLVDALAVAARTDRLKERIEALAAAGLDPVHVDQEGLCLWTQSVRELPVERTAVRIVAYLGGDHTSLAVGHGEDFLSAHSVRFGVRDFSPAGGEGARAGAAERHLVLRVRQVLGSLPSPPPPGEPLQWAWCGPGAEDAGRLDRLQEALRAVINARFLNHSRGSSFLARALAERALGNVALPCDLRAGPLEHPAQARSRRRAYRSLSHALAAAGIALLVMNLGWRALVEYRLRSTQGRIQALAVDLSGMARVPHGQEVFVVEAALQERDALLTPFLRAFEPSLLDLLAEILRTARQGRMALETLSVRPETVALSGTAEDWNRCEAVAAVLRERGFAAELDRQDAGADERVHFSVRATRARGRAGT